MFRKEGNSQHIEKRSKYTKRLLFFVVALLGLSACAPKASGTFTEAELEQQKIEAISTPMPIGIKELQATTILNNNGCPVPKNIAYVHANGPVSSIDSDGTSFEVRGLFIRENMNGVETPTVLFSEDGLSVGYEEYNKNAVEKITKETYVMVQQFLTLLHESIHSCTSNVRINETPLFDFFDETKKIVASLTPKENENVTAMDLVLTEEKFGSKNVSKQVINLEEILTHALTHMLIQDSGLFDDPNIASEINLQSSAYVHGVQFFIHILKPEDVMTLLSMKAVRNTQGIYELLYTRFTENIKSTLTSFNLSLPNNKEGIISPKEYLFAKILSIISNVDDPKQDQAVRAILSQLIYDKEVYDLSNDEINIIEQVDFNLFR